MNRSLRHAPLSSAALSPGETLQSATIVDRQQIDDFALNNELEQVVGVNVGNEKYLASLMWGQAFHAAPRSASISPSFAC